MKRTLIVAAALVSLAVAGDATDHAEAQTDYRALALCRSGGDTDHPPIRVNASSVLYSGYYLLPQFGWTQYGGLEYAPTPHQATRSEQTTVVTRIIADPDTGGETYAAMLAECGGFVMTGQTP